MVSLKSGSGESGGDGSAADDATCNFFPYNKCYSILVFRVSSAVPVWCPLSVVVSPKPAHLTSARHRMSHRLRFNSWVSSCTFPLACREQTFLVPIVVPSFGSLMVVFASVAHLLPPSWSLTVECAVVVDQCLVRPGIFFVCLFFFSFLLCPHHILSVGLWKALGRPSPLQFSQNWKMKKYQPLTKFRPPQEAITRVCQRKGLGAINES